MNKAFVKDDGDGGDFGDQLDEDFADAEDGLADDAGLALPSGKKNYITLEGLNRLKAELHELIVVERPKVVETVTWAASNGDRSENADYQYGKRRLREIDRRIRFLQKRLDIAEVVDPSQQKGDKVLFGATVTVLDESSRKRTYQVVGIDEADVKSGKVSWISPIGQALLQAKKGDAVTLKTPRGDEELEIVSVRYL